MKATEDIIAEGTRLEAVRRQALMNISHVQNVSNQIRVAAAVDCWSIMWRPLMKTKKYPDAQKLNSTSQTSRKTKMIMLFSDNVKQRHNMQPSRRPFSNFEYAGP